MVTIANLQQSVWGRGDMPGGVYDFGSPMAEMPLRRDEVRTLKDCDRGQLILCLKGEIWITQEFDPHDYLLKAGDVFIVTQTGKVVLQAFRNAQYCVSGVLRAVPFKGRSIHFN